MKTKAEDYLVDEAEQKHCQDCGSALGAYRQPYRGAALCRECWEVDMVEHIEDDWEGDHD